jgi:TIR domain
MSDIFISYAKADHALALKLSAFLEAEGWSVWWDKSLGAADLYRDEIMRQLAAARAVITIWTPNSIKSDWVRAEAGRAKADGKLIPVKTAELGYADIPLPFGEMHTENVGSNDLIKAAVVAQLAKPAETPSPFWQITGLFKYQVLTWIGVVGSAITLFANLNGVLSFADWARELVNHWHEWIQIIWGWVFGLIKVKVPKEVAPILSFVVFTIISVVGVNLIQRAGLTASSGRKVAAVPGKVKVWLVGVGSYIILLLFLGFIVNDDTTALIVIGTYTIGFPICYLLLVVKERSWVVIASLLFLFMSICLILVPLNTQFNIYSILTGTKSVLEQAGCLPDVKTLDDAIKLEERCYGLWERQAQDFWYGQVSYVSWMVLLPICWMGVILFSPLQQLTRRLSFVVLGVLTLVGLSEISKRNLHQYLQPPKVSDNSVR